MASRAILGLLMMSLLDPGRRMPPLPTAPGVWLDGKPPAVAGRVVLLEVWTFG
jgi:hypothetical protein